MVLINENDFIIFQFDKPLLLIRVKKSSPTDEEWKWTIDVMKLYYTTAEKANYRFSIIFDLAKLGLLDLKKYREWADLFIEYKELTKKYINKTSIITDNKLIKNSLNIFFNIYTTVRPMKLCENVEDAKQFVLDC